jgi:hypothetical protein
VKNDPDARPEGNDGLRSSAYWHERAEEARTLAEGMRDDATRAQMLAIGRAYDRMAEKAAARERGSPPIGKTRRTP